MENHEPDSSWRDIWPTQNENGWDCRNLVWRSPTWQECPMRIEHTARVIVCETKPVNSAANRFHFIIEFITSSEKRFILTFGRRPPRLVLWLPRKLNWPFDSISHPFAHLCAAVKSFSLLSFRFLKLRNDYSRHILRFGEKANPPSPLPRPPHIKTKTLIISILESDVCGVYHPKLE